MGKLDKANAVRKKTAEVKRRIKRLIKTGQIDDLEKEALENWAELLSDEDKKTRERATEAVSKYLFATKKEIQAVPSVTINCTFVGIKDE